MKSWKIWIHLATLVLITFSPATTYNQDLISNEDIEETAGILIEYLTPMFEEHDLDLEDFPELLKALISRYYIIFSRADDPLDTLEKMRKDYEMIKNNHRIEDKKEYEVFIEDFMEQNSLNDEVMIEEIVTNLLDFLNSWENRLQVIAPREAVKFLLYEEAYPDIMELVTLMVQQHYKTYKEGIQFRRDDIENYKDDQNIEDNIKDSDDIKNKEVPDNTDGIEDSEDNEDDEEIENDEEIVKNTSVEDEEEDLESEETSEEYDWDSEFNDEL